MVPLYCAEANHGANAGLGKARDFLEPIKKAYPAISYADLWIYASYVAIEEMGGPVRQEAPSPPLCCRRSSASAAPPHLRRPASQIVCGAGWLQAIPFTSGRKDATSGAACPPEGRLPNGQAGEGNADSQTSITATAAHVRQVFDKMGFNDRQMVCLIGAHALGQCHADASGYVGPWTNAPTTFSSEYFRLMLEDEWKLKQWSVACTRCPATTALPAA